MLQESRRLTGLHPCYGPHDPLRPRGRAVLSGTFHSLYRILPSLFLNPTLGTSVLTVVGYTHIGLPTSERTGQHLGLDYSQSPQMYLKWDGEAQLPGQVPCPSPLLSTEPHPLSISSSFLSCPSPMMPTWGSLATFSSEQVVQR